MTDAAQYSGLTADTGQVVQERLSKRELLRQVPIFEALPDRLLTILARRCDIVAVGAGTVLTAEGAPVHTFYVLARGSVALTQHEQEVSVLSLSGTTIGLGSVLSNRLSPLTAITRHNSRLLVFRAREFWQIAAGSSDLLPAVVGALTRLLMSGRTDGLST